MNQPLVIIDADSFLYIVGWQMQQEYNPLLATTGLDALMATIRAASGSQRLLLCLDSGVKSFRHHTYRFAPYKGTRGEKPEFFVRFERLFTEHLKGEHGAFCVAGLEADDLVAYAARLCQEAGHPFIISSPDKDSRQTPGYHLNYSKIDKGGVLEYVTQAEADVHFWTQMVCGDTNDNIKGIPGLGPDKCKKLFGGCTEEETLKVLVAQAYLKYFGEYYGRRIFEETYWALRMLTTREEARQFAEHININELTQFETHVKEKLLTPGEPAGAAEPVPVVSAAPYHPFGAF